MYQVGFLTKLQSYFWPVIVEEVTGELNHKLEVIVYNGKLMLDTDSANYSFGNLHSVMWDVLHKLKKKNYSFEHVLLLGYGGGSAAQIIHQKINHESQIVAVEKDKKVIDLANKYFYSQDVKLLHDDAFDYVKRAQKSGWKYSMIVIDLFINTEIPNFELGFFESINSILEPNGVAVLNTMLSENQFKKLGELIDQAGFLKDSWNENKENRVWVFKPNH